MRGIYIHKNIIETSLTLKPLGIKKHDVTIQDRTLDKHSRSNSFFNKWMMIYYGVNPVTFQNVIRMIHIGTKLIVFVVFVVSPIFVMQLLVMYEL